MSNKKFFIGMLIGMIITGTASVAASSYVATKILYTDSNGNTTNLNDSLNSLYNQVDVKNDVEILNKNNNYTLDEVEIGTWIDGKKIYIKGYKGTIGAGASRAQAFAYDVSDLNIDMVISIDGILNSDNKQVYVNFDINTGATALFSGWYNIPNKILYIHLGSQYNAYSNNEYVVFIEYTRAD